MATIKTNPVDCEFFVESDAYNWFTDNRPLTNLLSNDLLINAELEQVRDEVVQARTGLVTNYGTLDLRLDAMENSIGASVSIEDVENLQTFQYIDFMSHSEALRRASPSGWLDFGGIADLAVGDDFDDFAAIRTTENLGVGFEDSVVLWTGWGSTYKSIRALVNGWLVRLYNEKLGTPSTVPANHLTIGLGNAPSTGKLTNFVFLEVWLAEVDKDAPEFYKYGAVNTNFVPATVTDPLDPEVIHTVKAMATGGNWIQLRHRLRFVEDIPVESNIITHGYNNDVLAQGGAGVPVATYTFSPVIGETDDIGLWRAGAGDTPSKTDLETYDGFVYSIPMMMVHRRNSGNYSIANQNGTKIDGTPTSGYLAAGVSGHPAGVYYDAISTRDILDLRSRVSLTGFNLASELSKAWQMLIRGELRTLWAELSYDYDNNNTWESGGSWGHILTFVDQISNSAETKTNPLRDKSVSGSPLAAPDGQRIIWSKNAHTQYIKFSFTQGNNGSALPAGFLTYNSGTETLTFNAATLSGAGTGGTKVGSLQPTILKLSDISSQPTTISTGLGSQSATVKMSGLTAAAQYVGYISVVYPGGSGITYPQKQILALEVMDNGTVRYPDEQFGVTGTPGNEDTGYPTGLASPYGIARESSGNYIVVDRNNHRVIRVNSTTWTKTAQFGVTGTSGADNTHCNSPMGVCIDGSGNIYFCDYGNHRVVKLNSSLVYVTQFGSTGVTGTAVDRCNHPSYVDTDSTHLYVTDTSNHRILKIPVSMASAVDSFGVAGVTGSGRYGLNTPIGICVVSAGFGAGVWAVDSLNKRIVVLDTSLTYQYQICEGGTITNTLTLKEIRSCVVDDEGNYYLNTGASTMNGQNTGHCVYKFNANLALVAKFGTPGVPKTDNTGLSTPAGMCYDAVNEWIYVADGQNHRVVRLSKSLTYLSQFGVTGVVTPTSTVLITKLCNNPTDVDVDSSGNLYVASLFGHCVMKVAAVADITTRTAIFGTYGVLNSTPSNTTGLNYPLSIAVKDTGGGQFCWVTDTFNRRVVRLNLSLAYQGHFFPTWPTVLPRELFYDNNYPGIIDINYCATNDCWYLTLRERHTGAGSNLVEFTIHRYNGNSPSTQVGGENYNQRFVCPFPFPNFAKATATKLITANQLGGLVLHDLSDLSIYETTLETDTTINFKFTDPWGLSSDGTKVLVTEPAVNVVHAFDGDVGIYRGTAGIAYEQGDDKSHMNGPAHAIIHSKYLVIVDTKNHRVIRRHYSSAWVAKDGTIVTMLPPVGADKVRIYYDSEAYQGYLGYGPVNSPATVEAVYKSQVKAESPVIYASTLGLGNQISSILPQEFSSISGLTSRLPIPQTVSDYQISPIGLKTGSPEIGDDSPYLAVPVSVTEGLMGGQSNPLPGLSNITSRNAIQQVIRTKAIVNTPQTRGCRSIRPTDQTTPRIRVVNTSITSPFTKPIAGGKPRILTETFYETIRPGVPIVRGDFLLEAVPHMNYFPFLYQKYGRLFLGVISEYTNGKNVSVGTDSSGATVVDSFFVFGRLLTRG